METDAPDIPPHWLYKTQAQRQGGEAQGVNEPCQLPRIANEIAKLRGLSELDLMQATTRNALQALPRLAAWVQVSSRVRDDTRVSGTG